jgi:putative addiction module component (TIGR02574 family)
MRMATVSLSQILEMPTQDRIRLVELIWDSIALAPESLSVSAEIKSELQARLMEFEADPEAGVSWEEVKTHIHNGTWRTA